MSAMVVAVELNGDSQHNNVETQLSSSRTGVTTTKTKKAYWPHLMLLIARQRLVAP